MGTSHKSEAPVRELTKTEIDLAVAEIVDRLTRTIRFANDVAKELEDSEDDNIDESKVFAAFAEKHGARKAAYAGSSDGGLVRWFAERWRNESGGIGYDRKNTLYRPTVRVTSETPKTWGELAPRDVKAAKAEKKAKGRVFRFKRPV